MSLLTHGRRRRALAVALAVGGCVTAALTAAVPAGSASAEPPSAPLKLIAPGTITAQSYEGDVYLEQGVGLEAVGSSFELWSKRPSFSGGILTDLKRDGTTTRMPDDFMTSWEGLSQFLNVRIRNKDGRTVYHRWVTTCLNGESRRVVPDGDAHSPYPWGCGGNPFTEGSVQGIAKGWATQLPVSGYESLRLRPGTYTLAATIRPPYRDAFGIPYSDARTVSKLKVVRGEDCCYFAARKSGSTLRSGAGVAAHTNAPKPASTTGPVGRRLTADPSGPQPNLRSAPAWGMGITGRGNYLAFAATVWNAGTSPLVVDGYRRTGENVMDAYQYFFDSDGNQTGYVPVGTMEWDPRKTHHHWHFEDFARYDLLSADKQLVRRSTKEAFCLANTDAMDYTLPSANWRPDGTDLSTACGDLSSLSVREVLDTGSGDTYEQYRAGQSFNLRGLPNGIYYVSVHANPEGNLTETTTSDNQSLRKVRIGGRDGHRTVRTYAVGLVTD